MHASSITLRWAPSLGLGMVAVLAVAWLWPSGPETLETTRERPTPPVVAKTKAPSEPSVPVSAALLNPEVRTLSVPVAAMPNDSSSSFPASRHWNPQPWNWMQAQWDRAAVLVASARPGLSVRSRLETPPDPEPSKPARSRSARSGADPVPQAHESFDPEEDEAHPSNVRALQRLPRADDDRGPIGGVAAGGLHVDRIAVGAMYDRGECWGTATGFARGETKDVHVCFRVVHPRKRETVKVLWERDGKTQRRTFVTIPRSHHGYRTRAGLTLREGYEGEWVARVIAKDGTELAKIPFRVDG